MKKFNLKNIKVRLLFWYTISTVFILSVFSYVLLNLFYKQNIKTVDQQLITVVNEINYNKHFYTPFDHDEFMIKNLYINIYKHHNNKFIKLVSTKPEQDIKQLEVLTKNNMKIFTSQYNIRVVRLHSDKTDENIYIEVATTLKDKIDPSLNHLKSVLFTLLPILLITVITAIYFIIHNSLNPVKKAINEVNDIKADQLQKRLTLNNSDDEIDQLISTFNFMLEKLEKSFTKIKRFSNDVSHELKTPITVIIGEIELGLRKDRTNEQYKDILHIVHEETKSLQKLIDSLLFLSESNDKEIRATLENVELDEILIDVIAQNKHLISQKNITVEFLKLENIICKAHPLLLKILIGNIIQNSIKYSHKDSKIEIYLDKEKLTIKDYGMGIKKEDIENIFDRFYQVDKSRVGSGYGLGLSIVKNIAALYDFKIILNSQYGKYTEFTIKL